MFFIHSIHYNPYPKPISRLLGDLVEGIYDAKKDAIVFTARYGQKATSVHGEKIVRIPNLGGLSEYLPLKLLDYISFYTFSFIASLWFRIFYSSPTSIYRSSFGISTFFSFATSKMFKGRVYLWVLDRYPDNLFENNTIKNPKLFKILKKIEIFLQRNVTGIIFETKSDQQDYIFHKGASNSIQISTWSEEFSSKLLKEPDFWREKDLSSKKVFLFSGNISNSVNIIDMVNFFEDRSDYILLILGEGSEKNKLLSIIESKNLNNIFIYSFQEDSIYRFLLKNVEFGIVSLKKNVSIFSSKITSYLAFGLPILAFISKENEMSDLILNNNCGYVFDKDANSYKDIKLNKNKELINNTKLLSKQFSKDFGVSEFIKFVSTN